MGGVVAGKRWTCGFVFLTLSALCFGGVPAYSQTPTPKPVYRLQRVVIDAGHGGKDPGALGHFSKEKDIALKIALKLGELIEKYFHDVEVFYTRKKDVYLSLHERTVIANENKADLFISIHCNWLKNHGIYGTETYVMGIHKSKDNFEVAKRENSVILLEEDSLGLYQGFNPASPESYILFNMYQNAYLANSLNFAAKVERQFKTRVGKHSRGVKTAGFWVLWGTSMPSVLIETGYLSNSGEERVLNNRQEQTYIASAILRAFRSYKKEVESQ